MGRRMQYDKARQARKVYSFLRLMKLVVHRRKPERRHRKLRFKTLRYLRALSGLRW